MGFLKILPSVYKGSSSQASSGRRVIASSSKWGRVSEVASNNDNNNRNVVKKEAEKILKYKILTTEIHRTWIVKTKVIPVII